MECRGQAVQSIGFTVCGEAQSEDRKGCIPHREVHFTSPIIAALPGWEELCLGTSVPSDCAVSLAAATPRRNHQVVHMF